MTYTDVMALQWELLASERPRELLAEEQYGSAARRVVADGMTHGWWLDRARREARLLAVLRRVFPASSVAFAASGEGAVRRFTGSSHFRRRAREVGSTYPPDHATARAFVEFVRAGGWMPTQWWPDCFRYEAGLAIPSEGLFPSRQKTPAGEHVLDESSWVAGAGHDFDTYAENLGRSLTTKPWGLAIQVHYPQVKDTLVFNRADGGRVRRVRLTGPTAGAVWAALDPSRPSSAAAVDPRPALDRLVAAGFLQRVGR